MVIVTQGQVNIVGKLYQFHHMVPLKSQTLSYALFLTTLSFVLWLIVASTASSYLVLHNRIKDYTFQINRLLQAEVKRRKIQAKEKNAKVIALQRQM